MHTEPVIPVLPIARYRFRFTATATAALPEYSGSAWRGAFGHALKRAVCVTRLPKCDACLLRGACSYAYVFETPPPADAAKMRKYTAAPHPFVLLPDPAGGRVGAGEAIELRVTLFGRAQAHLPYVIHALAAAAAEGLGARRVPLQLAGVLQELQPGTEQWAEIYRPGCVPAGWNAPPAAIPPPPRSCRITFLTPLRLKRDDALVRPEQFRFEHLASSLLRRLSMLTYFHAETPLETDFAGLTRLAAAVELDAARLRWRDWTRRSSRQDAILQMGGLVGEVFLDTRGRDALWPYLWLGQLTHAGAGTVMGLGHYRVEAASLPDNA